MEGRDPIPGEITIEEVIRAACSFVDLQEQDRFEEKMREHLASLPEEGKWWR